MDQIAVIFAPFGRDEDILAEIVAGQGLAPERASTVGEFAARLTENPHTIILTQEALTDATLAHLAKAAEAQPFWSSLPVLALLDSVDGTDRTVGHLRKLGPAIDLLLVRRPSPRETLESALRSLARARNGQFKIRDQLDQLTEQQTHLKFLLGELDHRVKNMLAKIQAIAKITGRQTEDNEQFVSVFMDRIQAMARAHEALAGDYQSHASLRQIVETSVAAFVDKRERNARFEGPELLLWPQAALTLAMVLHELATNAVKHGALSVDGGGLLVKWERKSAADGDTLSLVWQEHDGPSVKPPKRRSFGTTMIEDIAPVEMNGTVELSFPVDGVRCSMSVPIPA